MVDPRSTSSKRKQTLVQLNEELVAALDREAASEGVNRSELIRRALVAFLEARRNEAIDAQYARAYTQVPQASDDLEALAEASAREMILEEPW